MTKQQHQRLLLILLFCYTILGSIPLFEVTFNYVSWFGIIYLVASYIRLYPLRLFEQTRLWGWMSLFLVALSICSVVYIHLKTSAGYYLVSDCNKILALSVAVSSFLWFKNLRVPQSRAINAIGASTFGVLLIHSNAGCMMKWLWQDTVDIAGHFFLPTGQLALYSIGAVLAVFFTCNVIDQLRILLLEKPFFRWYDKHLDYKLNSLIKTEKYV